MMSSKAHKKYILLCLFLFSSVAMAQGPLSRMPSSSNSYEDVILKLNQVRSKLSHSTSAQTCIDSNDVECSFKNICGNLSGNENNFYLYKDDNGHGVPNYPLLTSLNFFEACLRRPFQKAAVSDPFVYPEQLVDAKKAGGVKNLKANQALYKKQSDRISALFKDSQKNIISVLKSKINENNKNEIESFIKRIDTVNLDLVKMTEGSISVNTAGCEMPNAFYRYESHRVVVCPQIMNLPDGALFEILSHEIGHSIDPCSTSFGLAQIGKGRYRRIDLDIESENLSSGPVVLKEIPLDKLPTQNVLSCLQAKESLGVLLPSKAELLAKLDDVIKKTPDDLYLQSKRDRTDQKYEKFKYCSDVSGSGHLQEAFADWVASEALNKKLANVADASSRNKLAFESQLFFASLDCENIKNSAREQMKFLKEGSDVKNF